MVVAAAGKLKNPSADSGRVEKHTADEPISRSTLLTLALGIKLLLAEGYRSTDFEVHRNWLAITYSLPLREWYYEKTSEWTLDYPPFFAYGEWLFSQVGALVDEGMVQVKNLNYASRSTVWFQRGTVMLTELALIAADQDIALMPAWIILDHSHFQYNGAMYGLLIYAMRERSAWAFATLLCFKHIYAYLAPAFFVYFLRTIVFERPSRIPRLALEVIIPAGLAFGPFAHDMPQVLSRLFPFSRGLTHAYWAPNVWAIYCAADRVLGRALGKTVASTTRGLVGDTVFAVLPNITPRITFTLTLACQIPVLMKLFGNPRKHLAGAVTLCGFASFLFGWHVHEKAVLIAIVPGLLWMSNHSAMKILVEAGHFALLPLLPMHERLIALGIVLIYLLVKYGKVSIWYAPAVALLLVPTTNFLPLLVTSVTCAVAILYSWVMLNIAYFSNA